MVGRVVLVMRVLMVKVVLSVLVFVYGCWGWVV